MNHQPSSLKLSVTQLFMLQMMVFGATSFYLYPYLILHSTNQSYWIPIVSWLALSLLGAWLFSHMMGLYPGKNAFDITRLVLGWPGVILFMLPFAGLLWWVMTLMIRAHSEIISMTILHSTPQWVLNGVVFVSLFLASGGLVSIVRTAGVFFIISVPISIFLTLLGLSDMNPPLAKPWLITTGDFLTDSQFYASSYIWSGYLFFAACGKYAIRPGKLWKPYWLASLCFFPLIAAAVYLPILTFGPELSRSLTLPFISKMDSVSSYWLILENLTAVFISASMLYVFLTVALMLHCLVAAVLAVFPRWNKYVIYNLAASGIYGSTLLIPSWRWIETTVLSDSPLRIYLMFLFPIAVIVTSAITGRKQST